MPFKSPSVLSFCRLAGCLLLTAGFVQWVWNSVPSPLRGFASHDKTAPAMDDPRLMERRALEDLMLRYNRLFNRARWMQESWGNSMICVLAGGALLLFASRQPHGKKAME